MSAIAEAPVGLQKLGGEVKNAAHFTDSQEKTADFQHVAKVWQEQCLTFDAGIEKLALDQKKIVDIRGPLREWEPSVNAAGELVILHKPSLREFRPTAKAVKDMAVIGMTSEWFLSDMLSDKTKNDAKGNEKLVFKRDRRDAEAIAHVLNITLFAEDRVDQGSERLFRTWDDGTLRAVLSDRYAIVNNLWYLEQLKELIPGGLLSHWRGDADTIFGNVLIPDTIREESDSHYGGMLSIGNSEIGLRRIMSLPSVFRAICMNGCIWEPQKGQAVSQVHRGAINFEKLKFDIARNLNAQIPLLSEGISKLLGIRAYKFGGAPTVKVVAEFFNSYKIPKSVAPKFFKHWKTEADILGAEVNSAFGLQAALTRAGQELENDDWVKYDEIAGAVASLTPARWEGLLNRAKTLDDKDIEKSLGDITHLVG